MGINISVRKIIGKVKAKSIHGEYMYYTTEEQDWFDSLRYYGDRDFVLDNDFVYVDEELDEYYAELARPKDFEKCREWVSKKDLNEHNKRRLIEMLDKLEKDNSLVLVWSF